MACWHVATKEIGERVLEAGRFDVPQPPRRTGEYGHVEVKCGWAEFLDPLRREVVARGCVSVQDPPLPCPSSGRWDGEVRFLRGFNALRRRRRSVWLLRFEGGAQDRWVELRSVERAWAPSGLRATALISTYDDQFPAQLTELGGDG